MTNEDKARDIFKGMGLKSPYHEYQIIGAMKYMAEWKDEQFAAALDTINYNAFPNHEAYVEYIKTFLDL